MVLLLILLSGCAPAESSTSFALGTVCTQSVHASKELISKSEEILQEADARLSWRRIDSEVSSINDGAGSFVVVSKETFELISYARELAELTKGAFDPTIGVLTKAWDITGDFRVPSNDEIQELLKYVDYTKLELDISSSSVKIQKGQFIDLGAIAKGWVCDDIVEFYKVNDVTSGVINLGGNVYILGEKQSGGQYTVGIRDPFGGPSEYYCTISAKDCAIVVSGAYERMVEKDGKIYHHILDYRTGYPSESDLVSVCIVSQNSALADAISTAIFVLGSEKGLKLASELGVDAMLMKSDSTVIYTEKFNEKYNTLVV